MGLDLHVHSIASDGSLTPTQLLEEALLVGLDGIALTDHDTVDGIEEAIEAGEQRGFPVIPGIELTTDYLGQEVHVLGYGIDPNMPRLRTKLGRIIDSRVERAHGMVKRLQRAGINLSWEEVHSQAPGKFIGRPHIYAALKAGGWIGDDSLRDAFRYYLGVNGIAYLPHREIEAPEAVGLIRAAGGLPVLAHPGRMETLKIIESLVQFGLGGIEVYYPSHSESETNKFLRLAERFGLIATGGSDYHGANGHAGLGEAQAPIELLKLLTNVN
jgi:predicted metal-dependent phosphoesterase TrpH